MTNMVNMATDKTKKVHYLFNPNELDIFILAKRTTKNEWQSIVSAMISISRTRPIDKAIPGELIIKYESSVKNSHKANKDVTVYF